MLAREMATETRDQTEPSPFSGMAKGILHQEVPKGIAKSTQNIWMKEFHPFNLLVTGTCRSEGSVWPAESQETFVELWFLDGR